MSPPEPKQPQKQIAAERKRHGRHQDAHDKQIVEALERAIDHYKAAHKERESAKRHERIVRRYERRSESRRFLLEVATTIAAFVAAGIAIYAVHDAHVDSTNQYGALRGQIQAMNAQLGEMQAEQRPWVGLSAINPRATPDKPNTLADFMIVLINGGKSPAFDAKIIITGGPGDCDPATVPRAPCAQSACTFDGLLMLPDTPFGKAIPYAPKLCVIARVDYVDAAGKPHKTGMCFTHTSEGNISCPIPDSNYAD